MTGFVTSDFKKYKHENKKIAMLTAYDYPTAGICEEAGVDVILVGDSLGMVVLGYDSTTSVTMDDMLHHTKAVRRGAQNSYIIGDMPFMSYGYDIKESVKNAGRFIQEGGCNAVKLEGSKIIEDTIKTIVSLGIPVIGHIGYTPQSANLFGKNMVRGKTYEIADALVNDALLLKRAGVCAIVLELVPYRLASVITGLLDIPTIGIGAGPECDGQVLVSTDMFNMYKKLSPRHSKVFSDVRSVMQKGATEYVSEIKNGSFPKIENSFTTDDEIIERIKKEYAKTDKNNS